MVWPWNRPENEQDSVGGAIECGVFGLPAGAGSPDFGRNAEGIFSQYLFAVPAVKAVAFGAGTAFALMRGRGLPLPRGGSARGEIEGQYRP